MWIKICGTTNLEDALLAADAGADAVGFVFARSPRQVTAGQVAQFAPELPKTLLKIGVFSTQDFDEIVFSLQTAGLNGVQLHGELDFLLADRLRAQFGPEFIVLQTLHWNVDGDPGRAEKRLRDELRSVVRHGGIGGVLVDARTAAASGGTGRIFDWEHAQEALSVEAGDLRLVVAGGLTAENVGEAIRTLRPWGVDAVTGVELRPGKKDPARVRAFVHAARGAVTSADKSGSHKPAGSALSM